MGRSRELRHEGAGPSSGVGARPLRVSAERLVGLVRHLTERDWGSHPQLAHQLEMNRFATALIAATLSDPALGVSEWWPPAEAADHLNQRGKGACCRTRASTSRPSPDPSSATWSGIARPRRRN